MGVSPREVNAPERELCPSPYTVLIIYYREGWGVLGWSLRKRNLNRFLNRKFGRLLKDIWVGWEGITQGAAIVVYPEIYKVSDVEQRGPVNCFYSVSVCLSVT